MNNIQRAIIKKIEKFVIYRIYITKNWYLYQSPG
jgi:hypothetical protein